MKLRDLDERESGRHTMIDFDAVRQAYHTPPPLDDHVPTTEDRIAAFERQRLEQARALGIDVVAEGMGEHGSLIGGPDKRPTRFEGGRRAEDMVRMAPMPLDWFSHPNANRRNACPDAHRYLDTLSADHLAGYEPRPNGHTLHGLLRAEKLADKEAHLVEQLLARLRMIEMAGLLSRAGLTVYEIARAMHLSGSRTPAKTHWVNQFAERPSPGHGRRGRGGSTAG